MINNDEPGGGIPEHPAVGAVADTGGVEMSIYPSHWFGVSKCDHRAVMLYSQHYSSKKSGKSITDWLSHGITANGESMTLLTMDSAALFVWLKQIKRDDREK